MPRDCVAAGVVHEPGGGKKLFCSCKRRQLLLAASPTLNCVVAMFLSFHERCIVSDLCAHHPAVVAILELQRDYSGKRITMKEMVEVITSCVQDPATVRNPTHTFKRGVEG